MKRLLTNYITPLFCGILLLGSVQLNASHFMGGNITYSCTGPNTFAFTVTLYRDCNGIGMPTFLDMSITSASCGLGANFRLELVSSSANFPNPTIVTPICPGELDECLTPAGTYGIERYVYAYVPGGPNGSNPPITLPQGCTDWVVATPPLNARNGAITTGPNGNLHLESTINNADAPCNDSPLFLNDPTPFVCIGSNVNYSHGVTEFNGDSLVFSLTPCLNGSNNPVNYNAPYTFASPLASATGVNINSQTGAITFTPTQAQVTVICVLVEEYRNGVKIGDVLRDIQFTVLNCTNPLPTVTGTGTIGNTTGSVNITVCEGDSIDFTLFGADGNGNNMDMFWNAAITNPGASFTVTNNNSNAPVGRFRWITDRNSSGFYIFTVTLQDDECPLNGVNVFTYSIDVRDIPDVDAGSYQVSCNAGDTVLLAGVANGLDSLYEWSGLFGGTIIDVNSLTTQLVPVNAGAYKLIKTYKFGCMDSSLVAVDISPGDTIPALTDANICLGDSVQLDATINVVTIPPTTFSNNTIDTFGTVADTTFSTINVSGIQPGIFDVSMLQSVCLDITYPLASFLSLSLVSPSGTVINLSSNNGSGGGNYTNTCFTPTAATAIDDPANSAPFTGSFMPEQGFNNFNGDVVNGTWTLIIVNAQAIPLTNTLNGWDITFLDITDVVTYDWTPTTDLSCTTCPDPWASPTVSTTYQVIATDFYGCTDTQSVVVDIISALAAPVVTCAAVTTTTITFGWGAITGASGYEVSTDNGATWNPANGVLQHQLTGLALGQSVTILVRGTSSCPGVSPSGTQTCTTTPCTLGASLNASTDITCNAGSDGTIDVTATNGTAPYSFQIVTTTPAQNTGLFTGLVAGAYTVTVTDANGCSVTVSETLTEPTAITFTTDSTLVSCNTGADGTATITAIGGTGTLTYQWDVAANNQITATATALAAGTYNFTVTDASSCFTTGSASVTQPTAIVLDSLKSNVSCNAAADGWVQVLTQGGTAPYTYAWSANANGQVTDSITTLSGGTYTVTVSDFNNCTEIISITITENTAIVPSTTTTQATCNGLPDGSATASATGGAGGYTFLWDVAAASQVGATASNLNTGTYTVTITDSDGCFVTTTATVTAPPSMSLVVTSVPSTSCSYTTDGSATVTASGGAGGYTYLWSAGTAPLTNDNITGLATGTTYVTVTDMNGCSDIDSVVVNGPLPVIANPTPTAISCNGADDGTVTLAPTGGTGTLTFAWDNGDNVQDISGLSAGDYIVTITDANNCIFLDTATIIEPDTLQTTATMTVVSCLGGNDGTASALPLGGQGGFTYAWSNSSTDSTATALVAGTYTVTVTDIAGCTDTASIIVTEPATAVSSTISGTNLLCNNDNSGTATAQGVDGTLGNLPNPYTYVWSTTPPQTTATATGLAAGTYTVTVTDGNGCTTTNTVTLTEPAVLAGTMTGTPASCFGATDGTTTIAATGGTRPYTYAWSAPTVTTDSFAVGLAAGFHFVTVTDANNCTHINSFEILQPLQITTTTTVDSVSCFGGNDGSGSVTATGGNGGFTYAWSDGTTTTSTVIGLPAGKHYVTVTDVNMCSTVDSIEVLEPTDLTATTTVVNVLCFGDATGSATVTGSGGTLSYTYLWDAAAANQTTATATGLIAGTYTVTVTDQNSCTEIATAVITEPATAVSSTISGTNLLCNNDNSGTATAQGIDGTLGSLPNPYTYAWNDINNQTTAIATGLAAGTYTVTVTDGNGCTTTNTITLTEPAVLAGTMTGTPASCFGATDGTTTIAATGGTRPYTYVWSAPTVTTDSFAVGLAAGFHFVTVTDANNCTHINSFEILQPAQITTTTTVDSVSCFSGSDGSGSVTAAGGNGGFTYAWSDGTTTTSTVIGLPAGKHYVTVTDVNMCSTVDSIEVLEPTLLTATTTVVDVLCNGAATGSATVTGSGGTLSYTYLWDGAAANQTTATATGLIAGTYTVTVTDLNSCTTIATAIITEPLTAVSSTISGTNLLCNGDNSGTATAQGVDGTPGATTPYTYAWNDINNQTTAIATGLAAGTYTVTVTDGNGCTTTNTVTLTEPAILSGTTAGTAASCFGAVDGTASIAPTGGTMPYTYAWSAPITTTDSFAVGLAAGFHFVTVTDFNNCTYVDSFEVLQPAEIMTMTTVVPVACNGDSTGSGTVTVTGGNGGDTYLWSFDNQTTATATGLPAGKHYVTVTDVNSCSTVDSVDVIEPTAIALSTTQVDVGCFGAATASATVTPTGGTPGYTYLWDMNAGNQTSQTATNLPAGNFVVTVTDLNGCTDTISVTINEPATAVTIDDVTFTQVSCFGGSDGTATAQVTGGTGAYTYNWVGTGQTNQTATGLPIGTYNVIVTDANGCFAIDSVTIDEPSPITTIFTNVVGSSCNGGVDGTATVAASGGVPNGTNGYTYVWNTVPQQQGATATGLSGGQTYIVVVTDANGCTTNNQVTIPQPDPVTLSTTTANVSCFGLSDGEATVIAAGGTPGYTFLWDANANNQTTATATGLAFGGYSVTVTDFFGCSEVTSVIITQPSPLVTSATTTDILCTGEATGEVQVLISGGTAPYLILWENSLVNPPTDLAAGTYSYTVTDVNGCELIDSITVSEPATELAATNTSTDVICYDDRNGTIEITATGGVGPYKYSLDGTNFDNSNTRVGLIAGDYTYYVQDDNGCTFSEDVTISEPNEFTVSLGPDRDIQLGDVVDLNVVTTDGEPTYTYLWTPDTGLSCNDCGSPMLDSLQDDTYISVMVTDSRGCEAEDDIYIRMSKPRYVFIANAFTPNDDGNNDFLFVQGGNGTEQVLSFKVFDRWGELVYEAKDAPINDTSAGWNGNYKSLPSNSGVYVWYAEVEFSDGETSVYKGSTVLIR